MHGLDDAMPSPRRGFRTPGALAVALAVLIAPPALAETGAQANAARPGLTATRATGPRSRYLPDRFAGKAGRYYRVVWGIDELNVKLVESGELVRFTWRVLNPARARILNDKKVEPALVDPQAGVSLVVPAMEKVGQLRQGTAPEEGRSYWMAFSNKGRRVKRGDRVSVVVGGFRADGLVVD